MSRRKTKATERPVYSLVSAASPMTRLCMTLAALEREWPAVVGRRLAEKTAPKSYDDGVLLVAAENSSVLQDLNFKKNAIVQMLRKKAMIAVEDIRVEIGSTTHRVQAIRNAGKHGTAKTAAPIDPQLEDAVCSDILAAFGELSPELARKIARCRILSEEKRRGMRAAN